MKAYRKAGLYERALSDAKKNWNLMSPKERANNFTFKLEHLNELKILSKHSIGARSVQTKEM